MIDPASVDILLPMFEYLKLLDCGLYKYKLNGFYGLASADGKIVAPNKYSGIGKFKDNLAIVLIKDDQGKDKHYGYIDTEGEEILQPVYRFIGKRYGNYSVVMSDGKWSIFCWEDKSHQPVPAASYLGPDKDGLCSINIGGEFNVNRSVVKGGRWGYVSPDGKIRIEPRFEKAWGFSEGMAAVKLDGKWGFINKDGEWVVPCEFDKVESSFKDGEGKLIKDGEVYVFDGKGEVVDTYEEVEEDEYEPQDYYDDTPSIFDNPYYNDNLDMDQQSIEFWNSL